MTEPLAIGSAAYFRWLRSVETQHWWSIGIAEITRALIRAYVPPGAARVLDAGCGTGRMMPWILPVSGATGHGIDLSPDAPALSTGRDAAPVCRGSVLDLPYRAGVFDVVHSGDVVQHLPVPGGVERALAECRRVLRPGGVLLLRCSARRGQAGPVTARSRRFDVRSMRALLEAADLEVARATYVNCVQSLLAAVRSLWRAKPRGRFAPDGLLELAPYDPSPPLNRLLLAIFRLERRYLTTLGGSLPYGNTLICVARRPL